MQSRAAPARPPRVPSHGLRHKRAARAQHCGRSPRRDGRRAGTLGNLTHRHRPRSGSAGREDNTDEEKKKKKKGAAQAAQLRSRPQYPTNVFVHARDSTPNRLRLPSRCGAATATPPDDCHSKLMSTAGLPARPHARTPTHPLGHAPAPPPARLPVGPPARPPARPLDSPSDRSSARPPASPLPRPLARLPGGPPACRLHEHITTAHANDDENQNARPPPPPPGRISHPSTRRYSAAASCALLAAIWRIFSV